VSVAAIGIIWKAPQPGRSKTRLAPAIGDLAASELSACFLRDVAASIEAVPETLGRRGYGVYAPAGAEHIMRRLLPAQFGLLLQAGDDLGHVLLGATRTLLEVGHDCVLLVIGLKYPHGHLFTRIAWGTETIARATCERAVEIGLATTLLPEWYDVEISKPCVGSRRSKPGIRPVFTAADLLQRAGRFFRPCRK